MLVLSRKPDERIFIGDDIVVTVVSTEHGKVRLGIEAPNDVAIMREEVYRRQGLAAEERRHHGVQYAAPDA